jgi:GNAT superfamily N-acetyltransferase
LATVDIRILTADHLDGALALSTLMGWNQRLEDWRTLVELAPSGCFAALDGDRVIATAIGIDYRRCGWIAMMLVAPEYRGRGLGGRLLEAAMAALPPDLPIRLDATPLGRPLYERHDFALETSLTRHVRPAVTTDAAIPTEITPLLPADLPKVARIDTAIFGGVRSRLLERIQSAGSEYAWRAGDAPIQYCLGRTGRLFDQVGPVAAANPQTAIALVTAALHHADGKPVVVDSYDDQRAFVAWLQSAGFEAQRPLYRMRRPGSVAATPNVRAPLTEFAILGPEFG